MIYVLIKLLAKLGSTISITSTQSERWYVRLSLTPQACDAAGRSGHIASRSGVDATSIRARRAASSDSEDCRRSYRSGAGSHDADLCTVGGSHGLRLGLAARLCLQPVDGAHEGS